MIGERQQVKSKAGAVLSFAPMPRANAPTTDTMRDDLSAPLLAPRVGHRFDKIAVLPETRRTQETPSGLPQEQQAQSAPAQAKSFPGTDGEIPQLVTKVDTEKFVEPLIANDEIMKVVGRAFVEEFEQARTASARKKAAKDALAFYEGLLKREADGDLALQSYRLELFTSENLSIWHSAAALKISKTAKPKTSEAQPAAAEIEETPIPKPTHGADGGRWLLGTSLEPQADTSKNDWAPEVKTPSTQKAIKLAKGVTVGNALKALRAGMETDPGIVGKQLGAKLFDCTKMIVLVSQYMYFLDRSGFINFDAMEKMGFYFATLRQTLPTGTYFVMQQSLATSKSALSGNARIILQLDGGVSLWQGSDFALATELQHQKAKSMFGDILDAKSGILITVPPQSSVGVQDGATNVGTAVKRAVYYLPWAVRKLIAEMNALDVVVDAAVEAGIEKLAKVAPVVGQVLIALDMFDRALWFGTAIETAMQAQSVDEIDIAAQAMAYGVAQSVVEEVTEKGVDIATGGAKKLYDKKKDAGETPSTDDSIELGDEDFEVITDATSPDQNEIELTPDDYEDVTDEYTTPSNTNLPPLKPIAPEIQQILNKGEHATPSDQKKIIEYLMSQGATLSPQDSEKLLKFYFAPKKPLYSDAAHAKEGASAAIGKTSDENLDTAWTRYGDANVMITGDKIMDDLAKNSSPDNVQVAKLLPHLWGGLHDNEFMSSLLADVWKRSQTISPERVAAEGYSPFTLAMLDIVKDIGGNTTVLDKPLSNQEFKQAVLDTGLFVIDKTFADNVHSMTIHLLHGLAVDRLLKQLKHPWGAADFFRALGRLKGTVFSELGNVIWAFMFDTLGDRSSLHRPETLAPKIKKAFYEFE